MVVRPVVGHTIAGHSTIVVFTSLVKEVETTVPNITLTSTIAATSHVSGVTATLGAVVRTLTSVPGLTGLSTVTNGMGSKPEQVVVVVTTQSIVPQVVGS